MPPHLQEIAKRRPDLVMTIWKRKQQTQQQAASKSPTKPYQDLPALPEEDQRSDEEFDSDNEDETTSLIHRDQDPPNRYKSVDKIAYPGIV